jgi:hypothetical protein
MRVRRHFRSESQEFEYRVVDPHDEGVYWIGDAADLETAKGNALFEAQTFVDTTPLGAPQWRYESRSGPQP